MSQSQKINFETNTEAKLHPNSCKPKQQLFSQIPPPHPNFKANNNNVQSFHTNNQLPVCCYAENSALLELSAIMPDLLKIFLAQEPIIST